MLGRRAVLVGTVTAATALALTACGSNDPAEVGTGSAASTGSAGSSAASEAPATSASTDAAAGDLGCDAADGTTVGYSQPIADPNFAAIEKVMNNALSTYGVTLKPVNANLDRNKQIADLQGLLQQQVDVLVVNPVDPQATRPIFDRFRSADIPIVAQDTTTGGPFATNVAADVENAAEQGAQLLKDEVGDGEVTAMIGPPFAQVLVREAEAFSAKAKEIGLNVVDTQTNNEISPPAAKALADAWKQKYPDLKGIWTFNDTSAVGVASSLGGGFAPTLVSINGQPEAIPLLQAGKIKATFDLQQDKIGQALAYGALQALCDKELPETIVVPAKKIDASNVADYRPLEARVDDPFEVTLEEQDGRTVVAD